MIRTKVKTIRLKVGKKHVLIVKIFQNASAASDKGNAIATNALNVKILKQKQKQKKIKRRPSHYW